MKTIILSANSCWYLYNFRSSTIKRLLDHKYNVVCIAPKDKFSYNLLKLGCHLKYINFNVKSKNPISDIFLLIRFFFLYRKINPLIIFNFTIKNNIYGGLAAYFVNIPFVNNISGLGTAFIKNGLLSKIVLFLYRISQNKAKYVYFQNLEDKNFFIKNNIVSQSKTKIIPGSGVNVNRFHPKLKQKNRTDNCFRFLYMGRFLYDKGLSELIESFKSIKKSNDSCELWLAGTFDNNNNSSIPKSIIEKWKKIKGISVFEHTNKIEFLISQIDCVVLPSYREGMPKSLLEACSMEIPVVTTNVPGCRSVITDGLNGFLCNVKDIESLRFVLNKIIQTPDSVRKNMGINGRKLVMNNFTEEKVINELINNIREVTLIN